MSEFPLVSVLVPTYKSKSTLRDAIKSVLNQTYKNIEVIVVDDNDSGSDYRTNTESIMSEFATDNRVKYIQHEYNRNGAAARNTAFKNSNGELICFLDDDDIFLASKIEKQVEYLKNNKEFDGVYCWRYQNDNLISYCKTGDLSKDLFTLSYTPYTSSIMITRASHEKIGGFDESYKRHQDYEFLLKFFQVYSIGVVKEPLIEIRGNNIDNTLRGSELESLKDKFLQQFIGQINLIDVQEKGFKNRVFARHYTPVFWSYIKRKEYVSASKVFIKQFKNTGLHFLISVNRYLFKYLKLVRKKRRNEIK